MAVNPFYRYYRRYATYLSPIISDPLVRSYFSLVASLFLVAFLLVFAFSPTINTILALQRKIADQEKILSALDAKIQALVAASETYQQVEPSLPLLAAAMPDRASPQEVVGGILKTAGGSGAAVSSLQFKTVSLSGYTEGGVEFSFVLKGSESGVRGFLGRLENLRRVIKIKTLAVSFGTGGELSANVSGLAFFLGREK